MTSELGLRFMIKYKTMACLIFKGGESIVKAIVCVVDCLLCVCVCGGGGGAGWGRGGVVL